METDDRVEDWDISVCLDYYNVYAGDGRDTLKSERFSMLSPERHMFPHFNSDMEWYFKRKYYWNDEGLDCCSNYSIAFHYMKPKYLYTLYYLTYIIQPYGIERRYPAPPVRKPFSEVTNILDQERVNKTLRGY